MKAYGPVDSTGEGRITIVLSHQLAHVDLLPLHSPPEKVLVPRLVLLLDREISVMTVSVT